MYSYFGICPNAKESLILFEAVKKGIIPTVSDRLNEEQRKEIVSGAIYIWDERKNPIRRWTDGMTWSNSRVVGGFLEYRESYPDPLHIRQGKYSIKPNGLRKRSICLPTDGESSLRLIAYFNYSDIINNRLVAPSKHPAFSEIVRSLEENPDYKETIAFLSSGKRKRRSSKYPKYGHANIESSLADEHSPPLTPLEAHQTSFLQLNAPMVNWMGQQTQGPPVAAPLVSAPPMPPPALHALASSSTENQHHYNSRLPIYETQLPPLQTDMPEQFTASDVIKYNTLPSPIWIPPAMKRMSSEDRRALKLLDDKPNRNIR